MPSGVIPSRTGVSAAPYRCVCCNLQPRPVAAKTEVRRENVSTASGSSRVRERGVVKHPPTQTYPRGVSEMTALSGLVLTRSRGETAKHTYKIHSRAAAWCSSEYFRSSRYVPYFPKKKRRKHYCTPKVFVGSFRGPDIRHCCKRLTAAQPDQHCCGMQTKLCNACLRPSSRSHFGTRVFLLCRMLWYVRHVYKVLCAAVCDKRGACLLVDGCQVYPECFPCHGPGWHARERATQ